MTATPDYLDPPIVEMVISVQFSPISKLSAGHFGLFWKELGEDWIDPGDGPPIQDQFELFDRPRSAGVQIRLQTVRQPQRFTLGHKSKDRLLQIQSTRFCLNWRKRDGFYPSYKRLIGEFEEMFARFDSFAKRMGLGPLVLNQWELTYIDAFHKGDYWNTPDDWATILPGLFGQLFPTAELGIVLEHRTAEWGYEIPVKRGRLHISAGHGRTEDDKRDAVLLTMTARGPVGKNDAGSLRDGLDLGHDIAFDVFLRVTSDDAKKRWGTKS